MPSPEVSVNLEAYRQRVQQTLREAEAHQNLIKQINPRNRFFWVPGVITQAHITEARVRLGLHKFDRSADEQIREFIGNYVE